MEPISTSPTDIDHFSCFSRMSIFSQEPGIRASPSEIGLATLVVEDDGMTSCAIFDRKEKRKEKTITLYISSHNFLAAFCWTWYHMSINFFEFQDSGLSWYFNHILSHVLHSNAMYVLFLIHIYTYVTKHTTHWSWKNGVLHPQIQRAPQTSHFPMCTQDKKLPNLVKV